METVKSFVQDVIATASDYLTPEVIGSLLVGIVVMSALWEWASKETEEKDDN